MNYKKLCDRPNCKCFVKCNNCTEKINESSKIIIGKDEFGIFEKKPDFSKISYKIVEEEDEAKIIFNDGEMIIRAEKSGRMIETKNQVDGLFEFYNDKILYNRKQIYPK